VRITFICSSLEPVRDGVGDYTRRLAHSLAQQGHGIQLIALNDRHVTVGASERAYTGDHGESGADSSIRLAASTPWQDRVRRARAGIEAFGPDWISVQFVSYGFNNRGLVWRLGDRLHAIAGSTPIHLMFHELWFGEGRGAAFRRRFEGHVQKHLILQMVRRLSPPVVHTQTSLYVAMLERNGIAASRLPLFGNVPLSISTDYRWLNDVFHQAGLPALLERRGDRWLFGFFGTLHPGWASEALFSRIQEAAAAHGKQPVLLAIGRLGAAGDRIWSEIDRTHAGLAHIRIGEQPADRISQALQALDFGIATTPLALIGKSSTVATMLDHGLPVIASRNDALFSFQWDAVESREPLLVPLADDLTDRLGRIQRRAPRETVDAIARLWLDSVSVRPVRP
jgi:hypothetical protein